MSMSSPNIHMRPYIGVESGTQAVPELSRLIGSATLTDDCIFISCSACCGMAMPFASCVMCWFGECSAFGIGCSVFDVGLFPFSFKGTNVIPHFGHWPGSARTISGCIGQVYRCACLAGGEALGVGVGSAKAAVAAHVMAAAIKTKICLCIGC